MKSWEFFRRRTGLADSADMTTQCCTDSRLFKGHAKRGSLSMKFVRSSSGFTTEPPQQLEAETCKPQAGGIECPRRADREHAGAAQADESELPLQNARS